MRSSIQFPPAWVNSKAFENALRAGVAPHGPNVWEVRFDIPIDCKLMVESVIRLLSLANQLVLCGKRVTLNFAEGEPGAMGYLNRMGFFDHLAKEVVVLPERPSYSFAQTHHGTNSSLVEIAPIAKAHPDDGLPTRLAKVVEKACGARADVDELQKAAWLIFAELIGNVGEHSSTVLNGYAALQVYSGGNSLHVAVSDCGVGIMQTLRPSLKTEFPFLDSLSDLDLLVEVFQKGISRLGADRGCGLKGCAAKAIKFNAELEVRLPNQRILLSPSSDGYRPDAPYCSDGLPLLWGTHIVFSFKLA